MVALAALGDVVRVMHILTLKAALYVSLLHGSSAKLHDKWRQKDGCPYIIDRICSPACNPHFKDCRLCFPKPLYHDSAAGLRSPRLQATTDVS